MSYPIKKLGEIAKISSGGTPRTGVKEYWNGNISWLRSGELIDNEIYKTEKLITKRGLEESSAKLFPKNSVLIALTGATVGKTGILRIDSATNQSVVAIFPNEKYFIPEFVWYFLRLNYPKIKARAYGGAQPHIDQGDVRNLKIPLPSLKIQKQIVERLDAIRKTQEFNDKQIGLAEELFQSLLYKELNPKGKNWEIKKLGEICEKIKQTHPRNIFKDKFRYIDISSIDPNSKTIQNIRFIRVKEAPSRARKLVKAKDILFATTRPYLENITYVSFEFDNSVASTGFCIIRANKNFTIPEFLYFTILSRPFIKKVLVFQKGASYPAVSDRDIYNIKIFLPPLKAQKQIVKKLSAAQEYKTQLLVQKKKLKELFDSVLYKSMNPQKALK